MKIYDKYKTSQAVLIGFYIIWLISAIIIHKYSIYSPDLAFAMTLIYLVIQIFHQEYKYQLPTNNKNMDIIHLTDVLIISTTTWILLASLLVFVKLYILIIALLIVYIPYIYVMCKYGRNPSD